MKVEVVTGVTTFEATKNLFKRIDVSDLYTEYFIVVPDRFTLQAEQVLFDVLKIESTFNINIVSLTNLAEKVLKTQGKKVESFSMLEGVLLISQIMKECKEKLMYYKKTTPKFCYEILKSIMQIKSSKLKPEDLDYKGDNKFLKEKFSDLKLIYSEYQQRLNEKLDSTDLLDEFADDIEKGALNDAVLVFAGFDSFTATNYSLIKAIMKSVKKIMISVATPIDLSSEYIYDFDIMQKLKNLAQEADVEIEVISPKCELKDDQLFIAKNLYSQSPESKKSNFLSVSTSSSKREEVSYIADLIKYKVFDGERYKDFSIALSNISDYIDIIEDVFTQREIPFYIDSSTNIKDSLLSKTIEKIFNLKKRNFLNQDVLYVLSSPLFEIENKEDSISFVNERKIFGRAGVKKYLSNELKLILDFVEDLDKAGTIKDFNRLVRKIIATTQAMYNDYLSSLERLNLLKERSLESQVPEAIEKILATFDEFAEEKISFNDYMVFFEIAVSMIELSALPAFCDAVFVGDATSSFYSDCQNLVIVGACRGALPIAMSDGGLISDRDINILKLKNQIEPTVKMINRRNRFKLFNNLLVANKRLYISYCNKDSEGNQTDKALFVKSLMKIFEVKEVLNTQDITFFENVQDFKRFLFTLGGSNVSARIKMFEYLNERKVPRIFISSLSEYLKCDLKGLKLNRDKLNIENLRFFFPKKSFSVSQIERFYDCPFKHFVDYGLRLKKKDGVALEKNELGSFYHELLENFVRDNAENLRLFEDKDIKKYLDKNFKDITNFEKLEFALDKNIILKGLYKECFKICQRAVKEAKHSYFKPIKEEFVISRDCKVNDIDFKIIGKVDRIDRYKDYFRVIDYKTGRISKNIYKDLFYGQKIQLLLYSKIVEEKINLLASGVYYFNARSEYDSNEETILEGVTLDNQIEYIDSRFYDKEFKSSDIISAKRLKDRISYKSISAKELKTLQNYALKLSEEAINQIIDGNIKPLPEQTSSQQSSCTYCNYKGICLFNEKNGYRKLESKDKADFLKEVKNEG